jgi:hypothetical protein
MKTNSEAILPPAIHKEEKLAGFNHGNKGP